MCTIIWIAGNVRYLNRFTRIGFHGVSMWL